jgi:hypothetical protein
VKLRQRHAVLLHLIGAEQLGAQWHLNSSRAQRV